MQSGKCFAINRVVIARHEAISHLIIWIIRAKALYGHNILCLLQNKK